jgi:hypothetical protein
MTQKEKSSQGTERDLLLPWLVSGKVDVSKLGDNSRLKKGLIF